MVKYFLSFALIFSLSHASVLDRARSFVTPRTYQINANLIKILFKKEQAFYSHGKISNLKIIKVLSSNGLLALNFDQSQLVTLSFDVTGSAILSLRVLNSILEELGYNYFLTKSLDKQNDRFVWRVTMQTQNAPDPINFAKKLIQHGMLLEDVSKNGDLTWNFNIQAQNAYLSSIKPTEDEMILPKPNAPYWIDATSIDGLNISCATSDTWFPNIIFFSPTLEALGEVQSDKAKKQLTLSIPAGTRYIRISDKFTLENIKHGLKISTN